MRWTRRSFFFTLAVFVLCFLYLQIDRRTLPGLRVGGEPLPRTAAPEQLLRQRANAWQSAQLSILTGPHLTRATRSDLGASIDVQSLTREARALGHTGNPFLDLWMGASVMLRGRDLPWSPHVDRLVLGRYVRAIRNAVERPPLAGAIDQAGWSIAGVPGVTLDTVEAATALEHVLRAGAMHLEVELRQVPPPQSVAIGSPDAVIYDDEQTDQSGAHDTSGAVFDQERLRAAQPRYYMPSKGRECMDPPYERFCQGPRKVAMPEGEAAERADALELGTIQAVGRLLNYGPRADWVQAAGGPKPKHRDMRWPAANGTLWRRFGYVRHPPYENLLHRGIDVGAPRGAPMIAVNDGIVAYADNSVRGYGNLLVIVHDDGSVTFSAHAQAIYVFAGQLVRRGQVVGEVGDTGMARGCHVHFEYHVGGEPTDPYPLL